MKSKTTGWMAALSFCLAAEAMACSAFVLHKGDECVMGFNENWGGEAPGFVLLNQPGRAKRGVTDAEWTGGAALSAEPAIRWTSRYGSLTFNCFGKDSPSFGVNEKGLMVAELGCGYPAKPSPPLSGERPLAMAAWVQYVLDRFSTVDEALEDIAASRLAVQCGTHQFFLADSSGRAGAIMFDAQGVLRRFSGPALPHPLLCNGFPEAEVSALGPYRGFGGTRDMEMFRSFESPDWRSRYVNGVHLLRAYDPQAKCAPAYAWMMLEVLNPGEWQMVYDAQLRRVSFCTARHKQRKWVDFGQVRFGAGEPTLALDVQTEAVGDVLARFAALTAERHRAMLDRSVPWGYDGPKADPEAFARDANRVKIIEALHRYGMLNP